jgi:hypothetical protein
MSLLFSDEELAAMAARYAQRQVKQSPPTPPPGFKYVPRTQAQWQKRIDQTWQSNRTFRPPKPAMPPPPSTPPPAPSAPEFAYQQRTPQQWERRIDQDPWSNRTFRPRPSVANFEPLKESKSKSKLPAITGSTPCVCGHCRDSHEYPLPAHPPLPASLSTRCVVNTGCECPAFCPTDRKPTIPRAPVGPYTPCAKCGHARNQHCTKHKPGKVNRLKLGELAFRILQKADGTSYGCRHYDPANRSCQCNSTGCSAARDGKNFCECEKFVNPSLTPKTRVPRGETRAKKPASVMPGVATTNGTPETVLAGGPVKPRRSRKKKTAFVTDAPELFPPASANP